MSIKVLPSEIGNDIKQFLIDNLMYLCKPP